MKISSILQYSTIDFRFLKANLDQLVKFSDEVIIPICDHLFSGDLENENLLHQTYRLCGNYENVKPHMFKWEGVKSNSGYYHNLSRFIGTDIAKNDWLLFVDADEIVSSDFSNWFDTVKHTDCYFWLTCYWYFREAIYQATKCESAGLLIRKSNCKWNVNIREERSQLFGTPNFINGDCNFISYNSQPLVHHYSWVRSKEEMIKKVKNWGHSGDRNWIESINQEFSRPFNGTDFVHGYQYKIVENIFNV